MKNTILRQKMFFEKRELSLTDKGLSIYEKDKDGEFTNFFSYDEFTGKIRLHSEKKSWYLLAGIWIASLGIIRIALFNANIPFALTFISGLVIFLIGMFFCFLYYATIKKCKLLHTDDTKALFIRWNKPSKAEVDSFIQDFIDNRKEFYRTKYFIIDNTSSYEEEIKKMRWLRENEFITDSEFALIEEELDARYGI